VIEVGCACRFEDDSQAVRRAREVDPSGPPIGTPAPLVGSRKAARDSSEGGGMLVLCSPRLVERP